MADALHLTAGQSYSVADGWLEADLHGEVPMDSRLRPIERSNDQTMTVSIPQSERLMRRGQSTLVAAYAATLSTGVAYGRHFTSAGTTHKATRRRFQDFLKNTLTDSGKQAIETESTGSGPIRLTTESQTFIAEYILRFVTQSFLLNLFDKDRVAYIRRKFGDPNYVPPEVTALLRAILPKYWPPHDISSTF